MNISIDKMTEGHAGWQPAVYSQVIAACKLNLLAPNHRGLRQTEQSKHAEAERLISADGLPFIMPGTHRPGEASLNTLE